MKIFIATKYYKDGRHKDVTEFIKSIIKKIGHTPYCFLDEEYIENPREMMNQAFVKLDECDVLFIEGSGCSFGAGAEAGFAKSKNKKIIIAVKQGSDVSETLEGVSDYYIIYKNKQGLQEKLQKVLTELE